MPVAKATHLIVQPDAARPSGLIMTRCGRAIPGPPLPPARQLRRPTGGPAATIIVPTRPEQRLQPLPESARYTRHERAGILTSVPGFSLI
jgi:hypothetical protein